MKPLILSLCLGLLGIYSYADMAASSGVISQSGKIHDVPLGVSPITSFFYLNDKIGFTSARGGVFIYDFSKSKSEQIGKFLPENKYIWDATYLKGKIYTATRDGVYACKLANCQFEHVYAQFNGDDIWYAETDNKSLFILDDTKSSIYEINDSKVIELPRLVDSAVPKVLFIASNGTVYTGSSDGVLYKFNKKNWQKLAKVDGGPIWSISEIKNKNLVIGTQAGEVFIFNGKNLKALDLLKTQSKAIFYAVGDTNTIFARNEIGELFEFHDSFWKNASDELKSQQIASALYLRGNYLYFGTNDYKINKYDIVNKKLVLSK